MISFDYLASPGQLGNQMFKYAALKGISSKLDTDLLIPPSIKILNNKYIFKFLNKVGIADDRNHQNHLLFEYFKMQSVSKDNIGYSNSDIVLEEDSFNFNSKFFTTNNKSFDIYGFFQSYKYFEHVKEDIVSDFQFKENILKKTLKIFQLFDDPVSIHVRRGDFLTNPNHSALSIEYYKQCIEYFGSKKQYIVFSDDVQWCKNQNIFKSDNFLFSDIYTGGQQELDLCLMSLFSHHVIANSTFSWWGAYLSSQESVLSPSDWFKNSNFSNRDTTDLYPPNWIQIKN